MSDGVLRDLRACLPAGDAPLCAPDNLARYEQGARYGSGRAPFADGGMHFNLVWPHACDPLAPADVTCIREHLYDRVVRHWGGSYSAEHGIGPYNQPYYDRYTAPALKDVAGALKTALDPLGLMGTARLGPVPAG
ncbi:MAG TPA: FAD-linked oxidase C-terminal domain-containing protein [Ramlibacter sp.]|nr:FAD-linked oxidase C-terminal domain-containing protein [Ramlibacter sp.]